MRKKALLVFLLAVFALCSCSKSRGQKYTVLRLHDNAKISFSQMIGELQGADFIFVGERHDNMENHRVELQVIKELHARGRPLSVGLEMLWAKSQSQIDQWSSGKMDDENFIRLYYRNWRMPWSYYSDIFYYLKAQGIPILGLNVPRELSQKVAAQGAGGLSREDRSELPPGLSCDLRPGYKDFIRKVFTEHAGEEGESFQNFCEAQVLWDKVMAWHLVRREKEGPVTTVVLCGLVHALKRGIPSRVEEMQSKFTSKVVVPWAPGTNPQAITSKLADYLVLPSDEGLSAEMQ